MKYKLKMTKTKMYQLMKLCMNDLPPMRECNYTYLGGVYFMDYFDDVHGPVNVCLVPACGYPIIRFTAKWKNITLYSGSLSMAYLRDNHMLRSVSD